MKDIPVSGNYKHQVEVIIHNPCGIKIRPEKQIAEVLSLSRGRVKKMMDLGDIQVQNISSQEIVIYVKDYLMNQEERCEPEQIGGNDTSGEEVNGICRRN